MFEHNSNQVTEEDAKQKLRLTEVESAALIQLIISSQ